VIIEEGCVNLFLRTPSIAVYHNHVHLTGGVLRFWGEDLSAKPADFTSIRTHTLDEEDIFAKKRDEGPRRVSLCAKNT